MKEAFSEVKHTPKAHSIAGKKMSANQQRKNKKKSVSKTLSFVKNKD